MGTPKPLARVE